MLRNCFRVWLSCRFLGERVRVLRPKMRASLLFAGYYMLHIDFDSKRHRTITTTETDACQCAYK